MPTPLKGNARLYGEKWIARVTTARNVRLTIDLPTCRPIDDEKAHARARLLAHLAKRMRHAGLSDYAPGFLARAGSSDGPALEAVVKAVDKLCRGEAAPPMTAAVTVKEFGEQWTSGELHRRWPDHIKPKKSARDDEERLRLYVYPVVGEIPLPQVTLDHAELVMRGLPERLSRSTRRHVAQVFSRLLSLAAFPARLIPASPIPKGFLPPPAGRKAFSFLYPDEDRALLACKAVPLVYRMAYGVLAREGMRRSEAAGLTWRDLDLERGGIALDKNKTDDPRAWALDPAVARALVIWRDMRKRRPKSTEHVFVGGDEGTILDGGDGKGCVRFRKHLQLAGITRPELFERSETRSPIRMHDLRATFITLNLANGRTETWVADRTGHTSSVMINRYRRAARRVNELGMGALAPLDQAIPELAARTPTPDPTPTGGPEEDSDPGADLGGGVDLSGSDPSQSVVSSDPNATFRSVLAEAGVEPARPCGQRILNPSYACQSDAIRPDHGVFGGADATDRDGSTLIRAVSTLIREGSPRVALVRLLGIIQGELIAAGDHHAARLVHRLLGELIEAPRAPGDESAHVVDLADHRRREDR